MSNTLVIYGTRPEYLKIKPLLRDDPSLHSLFIKQHVDIIDFGNPTHSITVDNECESRLNSIFEQIFLKAEKYIKQYKNIVVQGDTATVAASALTAYNLKKNIFYIESGLRSFDLENPYPEEAYRQMVSRIATVNFCPTELSAQNLKQEKVAGKIEISGNTALDNLINEKNTAQYGKYILITLHRNENLSILDEWLNEIDKIAQAYPRFIFIFPVHPNPIIQKSAHKLKYVTTVEPLEHNKFIQTLKNSSCAITDSGGIQEEGSFLGKKIIVCRKTTERPEGIETGHLHLCESPDKLPNIFETVMRNFTIDSACPYGDGNSASKINKILAEYE